MQQLQEIKYLTDEHLVQLEKDVNEYIKAGWTPLGAVHHFSDKGLNPLAQGDIFCQTIARYEDTTTYRDGSGYSKTISKDPPRKTKIKNVATKKAQRKNPG